jgi:3-deoxy-7-phosphoheptulonate synthase/chorismate mutase
VTTLGRDEFARLRRSIDGVNVKILRLLERRGELVLEIARLKRRRGIALRDPTREADMLEKLVRHSRGLYDRREVESVFRRVLEISRSLATRTFAQRRRSCSS